MVYVVSGDAQENVESAIGHIPGLGLAASNGVCFSPPTKDSQMKREWHAFDLGVDWDEVKKVVLPVMSKYTARTNGSFIKLTHSSIGWSYYSCDPEWGALQASHLVLELEKDLRAFDVRFVTLKGVIELVPRRLNKGLIVKKVLRDVAARNGGGRSGVDFILCMGDDISDEKMFTSVFSFIAEMEEDSKNVIPSPPVLGDDAHVISTLGYLAHDGDAHMEEATPTTQKEEDASTFAFTVAVGKKASHASQYVNDATDVANLLVSMSNVDMSNDDMCWNNQGTGAEVFA
uniref:Trehalose 6-phosphate phosphatase n=1 Tax=Helicotheca tamesis TaxID=374047 RepID=A0A7S2MWR0_9STRA